jgi:hypothetical protein
MTGIELLDLIGKYAGTAVTTLVAGGAGAYLSSYLRKKGENLATQEDIRKLVDQVAAVTQATKQIEARISDEVWHRQRQWEMKKEAVFCVMQALGKADDSLVTYLDACEGARNAGDDEEHLEIKRLARSEWHDCVKDFDRKRALAMLVCEEPTNAALFAVRNTMRRGARLIANGESSYAELEAELKPAFAKVFAKARRELRIIRDMAKQI